MPLETPRTHAATRGFERSAQAYDRGRPEYPEAAAGRLLQLLGVGPSSRLLELGSGTGKFTHYLASATTRLVASDPSPAMRRALSDKFPRVSCLAALAEYLPVADGAFDSVVCAHCAL